MVYFWKGKIFWEMWMLCLILQITGNHESLQTAIPHWRGSYNYEKKENILQKMVPKCGVRMKS